MTKLSKWVAGATLLFLWACGSPEQAAIDQFFLAARSNDHATLAAMAAVSPPENIVSWKVAEVSSQTTEPFALPDLLKQLQAADKERKATVEEGRTYLADHHDALEKIIPKISEDPEYKFPGKMGETQEEWVKLLQERKEKERAYQEAKRAVDDETRLAAKSMIGQSSVENLNGDVSVTQMQLMLQAQDGKEYPYTIKLKKYDLTDPKTNQMARSRWIIAELDGEGPEPPPSEASLNMAPPAAAAAPEPAAPAPAEAEPSEPAKKVVIPARELHGLARVQILQPETRVEGDDVISTIQVRNVSKGWLTKFTISEYWYDEQGNATMGGSETYQDRFMPDQVIKMELRTRRNSKFFSNQFKFSHANGDVTATVVSGFPKSGD